VCARPLRGTSGIFCANFGSNRGGGIPVCFRAWCGGCYRAHPWDRFPINKPKDEAGFEWLAKPADADRHLCARNGDHLLTPFQCDWCLFRLLTGRIPNPTNRQDEFLLCVLRRSNLDALWAREVSTVAANRRNLEQLINLWDSQVGLPPLLPRLGPHPEYDSFGVSVAVGMLLKSLQPGRYQNHTQYETIRKFRAAFSNLYHASAEGAASMASLGRDVAKTYLTTCPTQSLWFERFAKGCLRRMGQEVHQDLAVTSLIMVELLRILDKEWGETQGVAQEKITVMGAYVAIAFCGSFRGHEVLLVDLHGLIKYARMELVEGGHHYCIIPLLGRFKNEDGERYHLTPLASRTASGIELEIWVQRLVNLKVSQGLERGPAFSNRTGQPLHTKWLELEILDRLHLIQGERPDLIPADVMVHEDYGLSRSFRRGATTEARNRGVAKNDIDAMNRWRNAENSTGRRPRLNMQDHYSDIKQMIPALLRFSLAL
jgi:hypothetical protein